MMGWDVTVVSGNKIVSPKVGFGQDFINCNRKKSNTPCNDFFFLFSSKLFLHSYLIETNLDLRIL